MTSTTPAQQLGTKWGAKLATLRKAAGYTQTQFGQRIHRDQPWVSRYERGRGVWTLEVMILLAAALNKPVAECFEFPMGIETIEQFRLGLVA